MRKIKQSKKAAKGTLRKKRVKEPIVIDAINNIAPPEELSKEAAAEWLEIVPLLGSEKLVTDLDRKLLMMYCSEMAKYWKYNSQLEEAEIVRELKNAKGIVVKYMRNPLCDLVNKALDNATKLAAHFGLTPLSRTKIEVHEKPEDESPEKKAERTFKEIMRRKEGNQIVMQSSIKGVK